jgi:hypothetical protein
MRNHFRALKVDRQSTGSSKAAAIPVLGQDVVIQYQNWLIRQMIPSDRPNGLEALSESLGGS